MADARLRSAPSARIRRHRVPVRGTSWSARPGRQFRCDRRRRRRGRPIAAACWPSRAPGDAAGEGPRRRRIRPAADHLRNQRLSTYGHNAGPDIDGNPRVIVDPDGDAHVSGRINRATRTTPPSSGAGRWSMAGRPGGSCPTISAWRAPTACRQAPRWPTGRSPTTIWRPGTSARNGRSASRATAATPPALAARAGLSDAAGAALCQRPCAGARRRRRWALPR